MSRATTLRSGAKGRRFRPWSAPVRQDALEVGSARYSTRAVLLAPLVLILATLLVFKAAVSLAGGQLGHLTGFVFYWVLGGIVLPIAMIGRDGYGMLFAARPIRYSIPLIAMLVLLAAPVVFGFLFVFPSLFPLDSTLVLVGIAGYAMVNGTLEEVFWRGVFARRFPANAWLGVIYPGVLFGLWQLVPWTVFPTWPVLPGWVILAVGVPVGLLYNWVAWRTQTIRWTAIAHVLTNLSGIGALLIFSPGR